MMIIHYFFRELPAWFDDDIEDDLYCQKLYEDYLNNPDPEKHETITPEELAAQEGIEL